MNNSKDLCDLPLAHARLLVRIALMYYIDGHTQKEIGERLGHSRIKVNRLLQEAKEVGIVEININTPPGVYAHLEQALCNRYGLHDAVVVPVPEAGSGESTYLALAGGAAGWLADRLARVLDAAARDVFPSLIRPAAAAFWVPLLLVATALWWTRRCRRGSAQHRPDRQ